MHWRMPMECLDLYHGILLKIAHKHVRQALSILGIKLGFPGAAPRAGGAGGAVAPGRPPRRRTESILRHERRTKRHTQVICIGQEAVVIWTRPAIVPIIASFAVRNYAIWQPIQRTERTAHIYDQQPGF
jgi:hypothetical protein